MLAGLALCLMLAGASGYHWHANQEEGACGVCHLLAAGFLSPDASDVLLTLVPVERLAGDAGSNAPTFPLADPAVSRGPPSSSLDP